MKMIAALILYSASLAAHAQAPMGGPPHPPGLPSAEALATVPNLTAAQQIEVRKILLERRDAHEAAAAKSRAERDGLAKKDRAEHERIDDQSTDRLRKLLGDDGFRQFAEWQLAHRSGPGGPERGPGMPDGPRHGPHQPGGKVATMPGATSDDRDD